MGARWIHEIKFDGYRTQAHLQSGLGFGVESYGP
jgi:ATP-dependent DNA ligase